MNGKKHMQMEARINLAERLLTAAEKANEQLEGTIQTFTLVMAAIAIKNGGTYLLTEEEINAASGLEFKITKDENIRAIILAAGDAINLKPVIDEGYVPDKLCPFIMEGEQTLNGPQAIDDKIQLTDL